MWLDSEIKKLNALFTKVENPKIESILGTDELATIENMNSILLAGLRNSLFEPMVRSNN